MPYKVLPAGEAYWRPSNQMKVQNTDLAKQLGADPLGARFWRLEPGEASTWHRHRVTTEIYVVIEGTGRMRVGEDRLTLEPHSAVLVPPREMRQIFNDTDTPALWLVVGAPPEGANTLELTEAALADLYPEGPKALPRSSPSQLIGSRARWAFSPHLAATATSGCSPSTSSSPSSGSAAGSRFRSL